MSWFPERDYNSTQARWLTPDPAGMAAVDPSNPQSWNRYAYVMNNPLSSTDPDGLWCVWEDGTHDPTASNGGASEGDCQSQGGHWDQYNTITGIFQQNGVVTQINTIFDSANGGPCTTTNCGAGATLENFDQTLQNYTQGAVPAPDVSVDPQGVIQQVGIMTSGFTKQINCVAAAAYPIIATFAVTPDDVEGGAGLGEQGAETGLDVAAETVADKAEKLRRWHQKSVPTARAAKRLKWGGGALVLYGAARAGIEGGSNFANCEQHP